MLNDRLPRMLVAHADKCLSCGRCALMCSFKKSKVFNPAKSRIKIIRAEPNIDAPVICIHCGLCIPACPTGAISRNGRTGALIIKEERCNGCGQCLSACPYGVITIDPDTLRAIKCDLCDGDPACVRACNFGALTFEKRDKALHYRQLETAVRIAKKL
jgi:carbon-monoxide dehydrogenase iron sulfur subunit